MEDADLRELLARTLEAAYEEQKENPGREISLVVTKLEEAALWICERDAEQHLGQNALLDWLRGI